MTSFCTTHSTTRGIWAPEEKFDHESIVVPCSSSRCAGGQGNVHRKEI